MTDRQLLTKNNTTEKHIYSNNILYYKYYLYIEIVTLSLYDTHIQQQQHIMEYIGMPDVTQ